MCLPSSCTMPHHCVRRSVKHSTWLNPLCYQRCLTSGFATQPPCMCQSCFSTQMPEQQSACDSLSECRATTDQNELLVGLTWQQRKTPLVLRSKVRSQSSSLQSSAAAFLLMPALLTAICRPPSPATTVSTILHHIIPCVSTTLND